MGRKAEAALSPAFRVNGNSGALHLSTQTPCKVGIRVWAKTLGFLPCFRPIKKGSLSLPALGKEERHNRVLAHPGQWR